MTFLAKASLVNTNLQAIHHLDYCHTRYSSYQVADDPRTFRSSFECGFIKGVAEIPGCGFLED
jgi:hypothetical protein